MKKSRLAFLCAAILVAAILSAKAEEKPLVSKLRFGLTAVTLEKNLGAHKRLVNLLEDKLGIPVEMVSRKSYQEMSFLLADGQVDFAFVCGLPYVVDHDKFGLEILALPVFKGKPVYQSYLITHKSSPYTSLNVARLAGIMAAKKTAELIPLCHNILILSVEVDVEPDEADSCVVIRARISSEGKTGVEMEALTAVTVAALALYDMLKAADKDMTITDVFLLEKSGGKSGDYKKVAP